MQLLIPMPKHRKSTAMSSKPLNALQCFLLVFATALCSSAQSGGGTPAPTSNKQPEGWSNSGYVIHQSTEIGYRGSDVTGSGTMYNTLVNLQSGPRLLQQTLSMQSEAHQGLLFDNLFIDSFGWGGDPNNALRARVDKNHWFDFHGDFRRDQNFFDYNLLANPLNPPVSSPNIPIPSSPHSFATTRRMSDFDLTLLPQSRISFRLGYSRNNMTGPSYSSVHEGTDASLFQPWNTTLNSYRLGADLKLLAGTVISYDQFLNYYKGDTTWQLNPVVQTGLPGASSPVELGLPIDTGNRSPCAITAPATSLIDASGNLTNVACNGYFSYNRSDRIRTSSPTERVSLHSSYFKRLDLSASYAYTSADMNSPFNEFFNGLVQRSRIRQITVTGPARAMQVSNVADFTATFHITEHIRVVDTFRFWSYRIPESFNSTETDWTVPGSGSCALPTCSLLTPLSSTTQTATTTPDQRSFNQDWKRNEVDAIWDVSKKLGARAGFRYGDKSFRHILDFLTGDEDNVLIHEYTTLLGFWAKPLPGMRLNFDWEHSNYDDTIVRIGPRKEARYRVLASYTPKPWAVLAGSINIWQNSNGDSLVDYHGHNQNYGFNASLAPKERYGLDLAYNYNNYLQSALICFNDADTTLPVVINAGTCVANAYNDDGNPLLTNGRYSSATHYGMAAVMFKPIPRVDLHLGYGITSVGGQAPQFNALQPFGSLQYNYHQPLANVAVDVGHNLTAMAGWNYYQYGEKSFVGPTDPRYFHANNATLSLRWAF
jgi:hypothetical protein